MNVNTYRSAAVEGVFVTLPSHQDRAIIGVVDELATLSLDPVHLDYELPDDDAHAAFARYVLTQIVLKGYATHGPDGMPPEGARR